MIYIYSYTIRHGDIRSILLSYILHKTNSHQQFINVNSQRFLVKSKPPFRSSQRPVFCFGTSGRQEHARKLHYAKSAEADSSGLQGETGYQKTELNRCGDRWF